MNNVKSIELTKNAFGLEAGTVLTRLNNESQFEYKEENIGESFVSSKHVSVSESMIDNSFAKPVEWFLTRKNAKKAIRELEGKVSLLEKENEMLLSDVRKYESLLNRIESKKSEFEKKLKKLEYELNNELVAGQSVEWADEAMTVYYNLVDLLNKLTA